MVSGVKGIDLMVNGIQHNLLVRLGYHRLKIIHNTINVAKTGKA